jgi:hypothetical protein
VEVYFPGYGWVEFEPTADEAPIDRQDEPTPPGLLPTITPMPTATAIPTLTPTPLQATPEGGANATPTNQAQAPVQPPTPTPTPMPTATPPPPPDVTRVNHDDSSSILKTVLLTLGIFVLVIVGGALALLFTIWYVEYRGLGGLSIIERAYARMAIYARWLGLKFAQSSTPDERRRYMISELPESEKSINAITRLYMESRYGDPAGNRAHIRNSRVAQEAWTEARQTFIRRKFGRLFRRR